MRKIRAIKVWTDGFKEVNQLVEDFLAVNEFFEAGEATEKEIDTSYSEALADGSIY